MDFYYLILKNIFNLPLICFSLGILFNFLRPSFKFSEKLNQVLTIYILFSIGLKGGLSLAEHSNSMTVIFFMLLGILILWGLLQPVFSFFILKFSTAIDCKTAVAIAASFGSVSIMTFITAISFLEQLGVDYQSVIIVALAVMEIPAIISGVFLAKAFDKNDLNRSVSLNKILFESLFNKAVLAVISGLIVGGVLYFSYLIPMGPALLFPFKSLLCLFLFDMGLSVGMHRHHFKSFSWSLNLFGLYMPLIGASFGLFLSYIFGLDVGTGTLIAVLTASASYIAVPAAMRVALPQAKEAIYLPLSLGIAFPFNIIVGIPFYYHLASRFLA